jgi:DNA-dependent RNA polymerase auxiliary subunit epsilon
MAFYQEPETKVPVESSYALYLHALDPHFTRHGEDT